MPGVRVGSTSITVDVEVYAERNRLQSETVKVTQATPACTILYPLRRVAGRRSPCGAVL